MVKIQRYLYDITIEKNNFAFEVKVTPELEKAGILGILDTEEHFQNCKY